MTITQRNLIVGCLLAGLSSLSLAESDFQKWMKQDRDRMKSFHHGDESPARSVETEKQPVFGIYDVQGRDPTWGNYRGRVELRPGRASGAATVHHTHTYDQARFEEDRIALAWEGSLSEGNDPPHVRVALARSGYITRYKQWARPVGRPPQVLTARLAPSADGFSAEFKEADGQVAFEERWTRSGASGTAPLWTNKRRWLAAHGPPSNDQVALIFATFSSFHALDTVQPYVDRDAFKDCVHFFVFDPTDFDFYRRNPDILRVTQQVVDPISLVEARRRSQAYGQTLAQKAAFYDKITPRDFLNEAGMICCAPVEPGAGMKPRHDVDSMAWTGDYVATQAMRYLVTKSDVALQNMVRALEGLILCHDIAPAKGDFARTIRTYDPADWEDQRLAKEWQRGASPFEQYDWLSGANNDMLKGYKHGFLWAHLVFHDLDGYDDLEDRMAEIVRELLAHNDDAGDKKTNEAFLRLLLSSMTGNLAELLRYNLMFEYLKPWLIDWGNGARYELGVSDWSGNYMHIKAVFEFLLLEQHLEAQGKAMKHIGDYRKGLRRALEFMRGTRLGYFQLVTGTLGDFDTPPPELEDALWGLREFPAPKVFHDCDWRIDDGFCMSPVPNLPWKLDWQDEDRTVSLTSYPLFERPPSNVEWKAIPGRYRGSTSEYQYTGVDFLMAYWFGRYFGVIDETM